MKVIMYMAISANGMIARKDGSEDFLSDENWRIFCMLAKKIGCFVIGRKTYDTVLKMYKDYNFDDVKAKKIIVSRKRSFNPEDCIVAISPKDAVKKASFAGFKKLLLSGGGELNSSFIKHNLVDEVILNVEPAILGKGVKVFSDKDFEKRLNMINTKKLSGGIVQLHYTVRKRS